MAQVPSPAPWNPSGKAATIANATGSQQIVAAPVVLALRVLAAITASTHRGSPALRVPGIIVVTGAKVLAWFVSVRALH